MSKQIEWEAPPEAKGGRNSRYEWFYEALKDKPGKWAKYPGSAGGATGYAKRNDHYEVTTRVVSDDEEDTSQQVAWMRYVPEPDQPEIIEND